jgi:hypothetical protein
VLLSACVTGERPTLVSAVPVGDEAIEAVLDRLARAHLVTFTATYDIIPSTTGETTEATVIQTDGRTTITIGDVEFIIDGDSTSTCQGNLDTCVDFIDDARVSDLNITHRFWGESFAARLELDAARNISPGDGSTASVSSHPAACVDIEIIGGTVIYCALDAGVLARYFGADVSIELTSFSARSDDTAS